MYSRKQRKRRIGHYDVRLLQKLYGLRAEEIPVPFKRMDPNILYVGHPAALRVPVVFKPYSPLRIGAAKQV